jgi:hypothetical protein
MPRLSFCFRFLAILAILTAFYTSGAPASAANTSLPAAPLAGPPYFLNDPTNTDAPYEPNPPIINGVLSPGEYDNAASLVFPGYGGNIEVFILQDGSKLYIAFNSYDTTAYPYFSGGGTGPAFQIFLDTNHDRASLPQPDDYRLTLTKGNTLSENQGTGTGWSGAGPAAQWNAAARTVPWGWQGEFTINFGKLNLVAPSQAVIGLGMAEVWTVTWPKDYYWPAGGSYIQPSTWGSLGSSSYWSVTYWKPGPWADYAPSGMPDFDQRQPPWGFPGPGGMQWTHCGPVAVANSLWWFDSKFESSLTPPPVVTDTYRLVTSYSGTVDDHDPANLIPLVDDLANNYFFTNNGILGTNIISMTLGIDKYLRVHGLWDDYSVTLVEKPSYAWVADEVMRSEDVILLMGFWQQPQAGGPWQRIGGHYVTVAGVAPGQQMIAFSDPIQDAFESGLSAGRVLSGTLILHSPIPGHPPFVHNDAGNISHDLYATTSTNSPGGTWGPVGYPIYEPMSWFGVNPHPEYESYPYTGGPIQVEVEYALAVSPFRWKSSGYWDSATGGWTPWQDYAPSGLPDFEQRQDTWKFPPSGQWSFCGPVAAANSLWWFDSKFEPNPVPPLAVNDNYPLVSTFASMPPVWDDHDPLNVDSPATVWPPGGELVESLAQYFNTDTISSGTVITDVYKGLSAYIFDHMLRNHYTVTLTKAPDFWWVGEHVRRSSDVILLLGFWEQLQTGAFQRLGGHYVTVAGVDLQGSYIAFSDPWFDRIEATWPLAGMGTVSGWPWYTGRVSNGWLFKHIHPPAPPDIVHNDAGNVSHDIYHVAFSPSPGGIWGPEHYVTSWPQIENFWYQNGGGNPYYGGPIFTEVEWAVIVTHLMPIFLPPIVH